MAEKTVSINFRVTPEFKALLELAAAQEHRTQTNLLEKLLYDHCKRSGALDELRDNVKQGEGQ
jgi:uncharacterized protein (DUF1778 family)